MKKFDLSGTSQGRLSILRFADEKVNGRPAYVCICSCSPEREIIKSSTTLRGGTKSCGCLHSENARKQLKAVEHLITTHNMSKTPTYIAWRNMKARCDDPNHQAFKNYKDRGITYCREWASFENFFADMGECPEGLTLNRIDVNSGYTKENCEWATNHKQGRDRRKPKSGTSSKYKGVSYSKAEDKYKSYLTLKGERLHLGYSSDEELLACRYDEKVIELTGCIGGTNIQLGLLDPANLIVY